MTTKRPHLSIAPLALLLLAALLACKQSRHDRDDDPPARSDDANRNDQPQEDTKASCNGLLVSSCDCPDGSLGSMSCTNDAWGPCDCSETGIVRPKDPLALASDGLPVVIPAPSSPPPTSDEWQSVVREVTVRGSSALKCQTHMLREWLRVNCFENGFGAPTSLSFRDVPGVQAYKTVRLGKKTSLVVQVIRSRPFRARFGWSDPAHPVLRTLVVDWPGSADRPTLRFE